MCRRYEGCCVLCVGCYIFYVRWYNLYACGTGTMWAVSSSMRSFASSMLAAYVLYGLLNHLFRLSQPLCGLLQTLFGLLHSPCMLNRHYVSYYGRCVSYCILYVGWHSLHACCADAMCSVVPFMWAVVASMWVVTTEHREGRQGTKTGK